MEEKKNMTSVPYIVYESSMARNERTFKKMWSAIILMILLLVGSNVGWMVKNMLTQKTCLTCKGVGKIKK